MRLFIGLILSMLFACNTLPQTRADEAKKGCPFPAGTKVLKNEKAELFVLGVLGQDTLLRLIDPANRKQCIGAWFRGKSKEISGFKKIEESRRIVVTSSVFSAMLETLKLEHLIVAVDNTDYITTPLLAARIAAGQVLSVAPSGQLQSEKLLGLKADILFAYYIDEKGKSELQRMNDKGLQTVFIENYLEPHPLGRAEWIKVFGYMLGKSSAAEAYFNEVFTRYMSATDISYPLQRDHVVKKRVLVNAPFQGIWDLPGEVSYMGQLIRDAGAIPAYADMSRLRISTDIEKVFSRCRTADIWLNPGACRDYDCLLNNDKRLKDFDAFKNRKVYNSTKLQSSKGGNAYWETGVLDPSLVLQDIQKICYPGISGYTTYNPGSFHFFEALK